MSDSSVNRNFTEKPRTKRARTTVETSGKRGYMAATRRFIIAAGKRAGEGDEYELAELASLRGVIEQALEIAIKGQRSYGKSWQKIGAALGISREAAWSKWSEK